MSQAQESCGRPLSTSKFRYLLYVVICIFTRLSLFDKDDRYYYITDVTKGLPTNILNDNMKVCDWNHENFGYGLVTYIIYAKVWQYRGSDLLGKGPRSTLLLWPILKTLQPTSTNFAWISLKLKWFSHSAGQVSRSLGRLQFWAENQG